jgi:hypothetical protein
MLPLRNESAYIPTYMSDLIVRLAAPLALAASHGDRLAGRRQQ